MNKEEIFSIWSPDGCRWSPWVKPVLFAFMDTAAAHLPFAEAPLEAAWCPPFSDDLALVLDLPGHESVLAAIALAAKGYRPVPLFNAVPLPTAQSVLIPATMRPPAAVDVLPILGALRTAAERLAQIDLSPEAPPAFLLDANRHGDGRAILPNEFDNRSVSFTTDFPSANLLNAHKIRRVMLVQKDRLEPRSDLAHVLRRWQDGGIALTRMRLEPLVGPEPFEIPRPTWYGQMFQRMLASFGLRRSRTGGFGAWVSDVSAGG